MPKKSSLSPRAGYKRAKGAVKKARRVASGVTRAATLPARTAHRVGTGAVKGAHRVGTAIGRGVASVFGPGKAKRGKTNTGATYRGRTAGDYATRSPGSSPVSMGTGGTRRGQTGTSRTGVAKRSTPVKRRRRRG